MKNVTGLDRFVAQRVSLSLDRYCLMSLEGFSFETYPSYDLRPVFIYLFYKQHLDERTVTNPACWDCAFCLDPNEFSRRIGRVC